MSDQKKVKGHCPKCGPDRSALVKGEYRQSSSEEVDGGRYSVVFSETYRILECAGCDTAYCQRTVWCSEWGDPQDPGYEITYWPSTTKRPAPAWIDAEIDGDLRRILIEVYSALNNEMPILAAIGIRTAFDRATELLKIDPNLTFKQKLDTLVSEGMLSSSEHKATAALIDAGSAAAHRGWLPEESALLTMISILEAFLYREFVVKAGIDDLVSAIPARRAV